MLRSKNGDGSEVFITGQPGQEIEVVQTLNALENSVFTTIMTGDNSVSDVQMYPNRIALQRKKSRVINPWFGGNERAPHSIRIQWQR